MIQIFHDEASVKRGRGFSDATADWEFFVLAVDDDQRTVIAKRGTRRARQPRWSSISCHGKAAAFDFVCGTNKSCAELPFFINTNPDSAVEDRSVAQAWGPSGSRPRPPPWSCLLAPLPALDSSRTLPAEAPLTVIRPQEPPRASHLAMH